MIKPLGVRIAGTGHALPKRVVPNSEFAARMDTSDAWIRERTGIGQRHIVTRSLGETTASLACDASRRALDDAGLTADDMDVIIVATITPEAILPSTSCFVQQALCSKPVPAFDLVAACSGFVYSLLNGAFMLQNSGYKNILVIGAEVMSGITDMEDRSTCILFGDGAGAAVLSATPDVSGPAILHYTMNAEGSGDALLHVPAGGSRLPTSNMTVNEKYHYVKMNGREVYKRAVKRNHDLVDRTLAESGVKPEDIALVIPHQSNLRIIESARERMGLPPERVYTNIDRVGNTSSASIPICLDECRRSGRVKAGDLVLLIAFGAGFTWASALIRL
ncbi:MAG TPA: beta-ketoacyl-ACP synthase III [Phycisphaerae bacterium]|nr:beta-ketoacyl-ACP synthase III [Phycisphaerae bacterium]